MPPKRIPAPSSNQRVTKPKPPRKLSSRPSSSLAHKPTPAKHPPSTATSSANAAPSKETMADKANEQVEKEGPVYFWKPDQANGYLGQWFRSPWTVGGEVFGTAEMWMMVGKARLFGDEEIAKQILAAGDPRTQRALGRKVGGFDEGVWDEHKSRIVEEGTYHKFTISEDAEHLRKMLLETGERELVEASPRDRIWGVGFAAKNAGANRGRRGENRLGKALMKVRQRLREERREAK